MFEQLLNAIPKSHGHNRSVLTVVGFFIVTDLADVCDVREQLEQRTLVAMPTAAFIAV